MKETINKIKQYYLLHFSSIKHSFSLPLILSYLDLNIDETNSSPPQAPPPFSLRVRRGEGLLPCILRRATLLPYGAPMGPLGGEGRTPSPKDKGPSVPTGEEEGW